MAVERQDSESDLVGVSKHLLDGLRACSLDNLMNGRSFVGTLLLQLAVLGAVNPLVILEEAADLVKWNQAEVGHVVGREVLRVVVLGALLPDSLEPSEQGF